MEDNQTTKVQTVEEENRVVIRIAVRNLVEYILRTGDIDNRISKQQRKDAMQQGSRIHRKIQRTMGMEYKAEVPLKMEIEQEKYVLSVEGRADGIIEKEEMIVIDEIKGVARDISDLTEAEELHLAQAKCYAYIYAAREHLECIGVQMTYCNLDTEQIRRFHYEYTYEELEEWFLDLIEKYRKWSDFQYEWRLKRNASIHQLKFPFPYRAGQHQLISDVYKSILRKKNLFIQAPTGAGKTIATIFPAVHAVGEGLGEKIFYLTAKTITRTVAKETFDLLKEQGYVGKVLEITAKEKLCLMEEMDCNPVHCPYAKGHYDRINEAVYDLLTKQDEFSREAFCAQAEEHLVCPFEMCLDTATWADDIICDYNYAFDPNVYLKRFFAEGIKGDYIFLVDEAHNLVERGREMYSAVLYKEDFLNVKKIIKPFHKKLEMQLEKCNKKLLEMKRECENYMEYDDLGDILFSMMRAAATLDEFLRTSREFPDKKQVSEFYMNLRGFLNMYERVDENYVIYTQHEADGRFCVKLYCIDTAKNLQECIERGNSAVFFSATLLPINYYKKMLSTREDNYAVYAQTSFVKEQSCILIAEDVSSKYTRRTASEFQKMAQYIAGTAACKKGNYIAFFPSYRMMEQVAEEYYKMPESQQMDGIMQTNKMTEMQREEFLQEFAKERERTMIAFCVLGGIFSEGIDLRDEQLIGAIIVGTGLPQVCNEREILKNYYDEKEGNGFAYAFSYPGMNKVLQAAGRVIRTMNDKGVILLLDERFLRGEYVRMFPREWEHYERCSLSNYQSRLKTFWENVEDGV